MIDTSEFFIDGNQFWGQLKKDIRRAKKNIYIQTFSFEADSVGQKLIKELTSNKNIDRKMLVDSYSKIIISDKLFRLPKYRKDHALQDEVKETSSMFKRLNKMGVQLKLTNPLGILYSNLPARNHKKIVIIDDEIVYIGGINFSEHNFNWHDLMFRINNKELALEVKKDFLADWNGKILSRGELYSNDSMTVFSTNGSNNKLVLNSIFKSISNAKKSIFIESPYITFPFFNELKKARKNGTKVTIITTGCNNHPMYTDYLVYESFKNDISLRLLPEMTHLKAMLVDDNSLFIGSLNFDFLCYDFHREIFIQTQENKTIKEFIEKVSKVDIKNSIPAALPKNYQLMKGIRAKLFLKTLRRLFLCIFHINLFFKNVVSFIVKILNKIKHQRKMVVVDHPKKLSNITFISLLK